MIKKEMKIIPLFASPLMQIQLDLDTDKLTELVFQMQNKDKEGVQLTNIGGWQSENVVEEKHGEFIGLKKEITQHLQTYHSEVFRGMIFNGKENIEQNFTNMWVNINEKHHYNDWHVHPFSTLSGIYYIKHDGSAENGNIIFKNPVSHFPYIMSNCWPNTLIEEWNGVTSTVVEFRPQSNMLLIFPSWIEHKVQTNLKDDSRISLSFNTFPSMEKKS